MIEQTNIDEYIELCRIFGGSYDLVQTNGGNISIKNKNKIIIKRSGFKMIETEMNKGYVICDINKIDFTNENIENSVISGQGTPSIETFFHLLPKKYIVHLHPIILLHYLSLNNWKEDISNIFENCLYIEYKKPGLELSRSILDTYNNESIIFLQNHGIILCSDNKDDIYILINNILNKFTSRFPSTNILFMRDLYFKLKDKIIISSYIPFLKSDRYFFKLSPDISLYLDDSPIIFETSHYDLNFDLTKKIIIYNDIVYLVDINFNKVKNLEEMVKSYYLVLECGFNNDYHEISDEDKIALERWDKEKLRLNSK
uniref:Class II aldolase/adducin N-terminal domain-containing protein n=1 Tax=viral metagenome TaxID=1070528 RepID=A0A6C0D6M2_9ZZZZ